MAVQRRAAGGGGLTKLKEALAARDLGTAYIFHGEESYLREFYLSEMKKQLVAGFESFNYHRMEGKGLTVQALTETVEALPMMAQRTMVQVVDWTSTSWGRSSAPPSSPCWRTSRPTAAW